MHLLKRLGKLMKLGPGPSRTVSEYTRNNLKFKTGATMTLMIQVPIHAIKMTKRHDDASNCTSAYLTVLNGAILGRGVKSMQVSAPADAIPVATIEYNPACLDEEVREMFKKYM